MSNPKYLSSGELAELAGLSRQIIRHYEKKEILKPTFIDDNGYRYYQPEIYFTLEVIIRMRKLDIPLNSIKEFLKDRNIETLKTFYLNYMEQLASIQERIDTYQKFFKKRLLRLEESKNIPLNTVMVVPTSDYDIIRSEEIPMHISRKDKLIALAKFLRPLVEEEEHKDYLFGYLLNFNNILSSPPGTNAHFHAVVNSPQPLEGFTGTRVQVKGGLCLSVVFKGHNGLIPPETIQLIQDYVKRNNLKISDKVFVYAVGDHWGTKSWEDILSRLYIRIEDN